MSVMCSMQFAVLSNVAKRSVSRGTMYGLETVMFVAENFALKLVGKFRSANVMLCLM